MPHKSVFGTDGIRGLVGQYPITPEFALKLGWAAGRVLGDAIGDRVVIGKDTRLSGYLLESALEAGFAAAGMNVYLLGPMPTPGVAYLTRAIRACAGIVISASHNPHHDNGIKFFSGTGHKLDDDLELAIEAELQKPMEMVCPSKVGRAWRVDDAAGRYIEFCKASLPAFAHLKGLKIVVDCAHGATYHIAPKVLDELEAEVIAIGNKPDGLNINDGFGSTQPAHLQQKVVEMGADVGVALDGDGDRLIMVDHEGTVVDGDEILYILAKDMLVQHGSVVSGVVGTQMSNLGLEQALAEDDIPFVRAKVGDRHVMQMLHEKNWHIGGESSGHIIWLSSTTTGDGIVAALQVLAIMQQQGKSLRALLKGLHKYPQCMVNVPLKRPLQAEDKDKLTQLSAVSQESLGQEGRILLRPSGTEPLVRVMVEAREAAVAKQHANSVAKQVLELLG